MAEKNQDVGNADIHFTDDELGDISRNIVGLYARLQNSEDDKTRLKRQLTQNIAHELKTPVSSIRGYLETIIDNPDMDEQTKADFMGRCYDQSGRLSNLISDITMLSKIDEASGSFTTESIDISALLEGIRNDVELQLENKKMKFLILVAPKTIVNGNQMLLYSIFRNLTDNAIAYAGEGTTITIQCTKEDSSKYWFVFSDNGTGVPEEHLPHLFERFYRVDKGRSRKLGGTGLGLAIVKNAVLIHGGTISVKIGRAGGLEFRFSLPK
ncbi:MAG: ATP-binding protein [Bacteroides sp.]|nr:ATP-binding protein [Bacteroides sp.]